jgi:hypothetical protein
MNIRYLKNLRRVQSGHCMTRRWVVQLSFDHDPLAGWGWRRLSFGVYKVLRPVPEGRRAVYQDNIKGFYREYLIWLPWVRVE